MSSAVGDFICATRNMLAQGFRSLPVLLGGSILFMGLVQGNFNLLFFFTGMFILAPTMSVVLNAAIEFLFSLMGSWAPPASLWQVPAANAEACSIFTYGNSSELVTMTVVPSTWFTIMAFFFSYLFSNALKLYKLQESSEAPKAAVKARKSQAVIAMVLTIAIGIPTFILRYATSCETGFGLLVSLAAGGFLGYSWYEFMNSCGFGRLDDIFGISNRILPLQSYEDSDPTVCIPTAQKN